MPKPPIGSGGSIALTPLGAASIRCHLEAPKGGPCRVTPFGFREGGPNEHSIRTSLGRRRRCCPARVQHPPVGDPDAGRWPGQRRPEPASREAARPGPAKRLGAVAFGVESVL